MDFDRQDLSFLRQGERVTLQLRALYERCGYKKYRMGQFEEFELYQQHKNFLKSKHIISFNDMDGRMLALKPDVTLSIAKNTHASQDAAEKFYYVENVYRLDDATGSFAEINQLGLEHIGKLSIQDTAGVICLAQKTLREVSADSRMQLSHVGFLLELLSSLSIDEADRHGLIECIQQRSGHELAERMARLGVPPAAAKMLREAASLNGEFSQTMKQARALAITPGMNEVLDQLDAVHGELEKCGCADRLMLDFSLISDIDYYSGFVFRGYVQGIARAVLAGGDYGSLLQKFGKDLDAIGFALYLSELDVPQTQNDPVSRKSRELLTVALPKGRLGDQVYERFSGIGYECKAIYDDNRKLVFENEETRVRYLLVKPSDVAIYVEHGAADVGVVGKDILLDAKSDVYELLDLEIGKCRLAVAARNGYAEDRDRVLRVATKFANVTKDYYSARNREIEIIHLNGSIELAPILGLSDVIVDIVESGKTLVENDLHVEETIAQVSARLIANRSSYMFKRDEIGAIVSKLQEVNP